MNNWYMLTLIGTDRTGITAAVTQALFDADMNLGEASMLRLGGSFTMMLMVSGATGASTVVQAVEPVAREMGLKVHVDAIEGQLHQHLEPNVHVTVSGADRAGIVAAVTGALADAGLHITDLSSDVAGDSSRPVYIMQIEGRADSDVAVLQTAVRARVGDDVEVHIQSLQTLLA